jgi:hypothetical protein
MTEVGEYAIWFSIAAFCVALLWGFFVVAWRAREMMVRFLESKRAVRVWQAAERAITPPILARMAKLEARVTGELALVGPRMALSLPASPDFSALLAELETSVKELKEAKSMLMGNLTKMRRGQEKLEEMEGEAMHAAAAELGLEAQELDPELGKKMKWAKLAARLDPNDPSLSLVEAAGVVVAREALERFQKDGSLGDVLRRGPPSAATKEASRALYY